VTEIRRKSKVNYHNNGTARGRVIVVCVAPGGETRATYTTITTSMCARLFFKWKYLQQQRPRERTEKVYIYICRCIRIVLMRVCIEFGQDVSSGCRKHRKSCGFWLGTICVRTEEESRGPFFSFISLARTRTSAPDTTITPECGLRIYILYTTYIRRISNTIIYNNTNDMSCLVDDVVHSCHCARSIFPSRRGHGDERQKRH
jgi:hypothetical protein